MPRRYPEWLTYVFDRPTTEPEWFLQQHSAFDVGSPQNAAELFIETMVNCGRDLMRFSETQVSNGLYYIFDRAFSDFATAITRDSIPLEIRKKAIVSMKHLYLDCFEPRCAPILSHLDESGGNPLNSICYMLWDITPLAEWEGRVDEAVFYEAVLALLEFVLSLRNDACIEGALHGLGHLHDYCKAEVESIILRFLQKNPRLRQELVEYASNAARGSVL